jgi:hypothetical protein
MMAPMFATRVVNGRRTVGVAALALAIGAGAAGASTLSEISSVHVAVATSSARLRVDETLTVSGFVINTTRRGLRLFARPPLHATAYVHLRDATGHRLASRPLVRIEPAPPRAADYPLLAPGQSLAVEIPARLVREASSAGLSLVLGRLPDSAIDVPRPGRYLVVFEFEYPRALAEEAMRAFGLLDVWDGIAVASTPLVIE